MARLTDEGVTEPSAKVKHSLDERVAASTALAPSEAQVARFFSQRRDEIPFMSAADIAAALAVSNATVVRTAQALGYAGLPALKQELGAALRARRTPAARVERSLDELGANADAILDGLITHEIGMLEEARRTLRPTDFRHAIDLLRNAGRVVVIGLGPNRGIADHFVQGLRRFGRRAIALSGRGAGLADDLMELGSGDLVVLLAYELVTNEVSAVLDVAQDRHAPCVLVTDALALALKGRYAVALSARRSSTASFPTSIVALLIVEALLLGLAALDRPRVLASLDRLSELRRDLDRR